MCAVALVSRIAIGPSFWTTSSTVATSAPVPRAIALARLEVDVDPVAACQRTHERDEALEVIARRGDVVAAAEIDPPHAREARAELGLDGGKRALERVTAELAERVEVESFEPVEKLRAKLGARDAEARPRRARVVQRDADLAVLGVEAQPARDAVRSFGHDRAKAPPLVEGVEDDVVAERDELGDVFFLVRGRAGVDLAAHLLAREPRLVRRARRGAGEIAADEAERAPRGEALERQQDLAPGPLLDRREEREVRLERLHVDHPARRVRHLGRVDRVHAQRSSTCQGKPDAASLSKKDRDPSLPCGRRRAASMRPSP